MIVLGIDPGLATTGFGVIEVQGQSVKVVNMGTITTSARDTLPDRLMQLSDDITALLVEYRPEVCGIEELFFTSNVKTGIVVAEARGVILLTVAKHHVPCLELTPLEVKNQLTGDGRADKKQMQKMLALLFGWQHPPKQDDANDALAIALAVSRLWEFQQR